MRLAITMCLLGTLTILVGCTSGGRRYAPRASASATAPTAHRRAPRIASRDLLRTVGRPAPRAERHVAAFTPPVAPTLPVACKAAPAAAHDAVANEACPGGNCAVPSFDACCSGGSCAVPVFKLCK